MERREQNFNCVKNNENDGVLTMGSIVHSMDDVETSKRIVEDQQLSTLLKDDVTHVDDSD